MTSTTHPPAGCTPAKPGADPLHRRSGALGEPARPSTAADVRTVAAPLPVPPSYLLGRTGDLGAERRAPDARHRTGG